MKKAISIFLAVVMVLALVACGNSAAPNAPAATNNGSETAGTDSDTIKIGYVSDLTGATALWGTAGQYGAELAVKDINEAGGVLGGKMLELVPMDGKGEAADSVSAFKKLVDEHHIVASIGTNFSSCNIPMASVADEVKVPIIGTAASNELVTVDENGNLHPYSFRMCFIDSYLGTVIGNYAVDKLGVKNAALFTIAGNTNSESVGSFIRDAINAKGANIVADEQCQEGDVDFRAQLTNIKAKNPDIIFVVMNDYAKNATFAKQAREMGIECTLMGQTAGTPLSSPARHRALWKAACMSPVSASTLPMLRLSVSALPRNTASAWKPSACSATTESTGSLTPSTAPVPPIPPRSATLLSRPKCSKA